VLVQQAVANTGGGGGGTSGPGGPTGVLGGAGGPGIVVLKSPSTSCVSVTGSGNTVTTHPDGDKVAKFIVSGNYVVND